MRLSNVLVVLGLTLASTCAFAGPKDDFVDAVVKQCGKSKDQAEAMATPGRSGNVIKFKTCSSASITIDDCTLQCKDASSSIGG